MSEATERQRFKQMEREQARNEAIWLPKVESAINAQLNPMLRALEQNGPQYVLQHLNELILPSPLDEVLRSLWISIGVSAANSQYGYLQRTYPEEIKRSSPYGRHKIHISAGTLSQKAFGFNSIWSALMRNLYSIFGGIKIVNITNNERNRIRRLLIQFEQEDDQYNDWFHLSRRIQSQDIPLTRARVITRTESGIATSAGGEIGARQTGLIMNKKWLSVKDKRTRRIPKDATDHVSMNNVMVGMDERFLVPAFRGNGANTMSRPHDPTAPANQVCNCRCKCVYIPARDASGRLLRSVPVGTQVIARIR